MYGISLAKTEKEIERVIVHDQCFTARNALLIIVQEAWITSPFFLDGD